MPNVPLQPGSTNAAAVKGLQDYLVSIGYLNQNDIANGGYGLYGPKTTAAVAKFQTDNGIDNSSGPGYWGPKTISVAQARPAGTGAQSDAEVAKLQAQLGVPQTGVYDQATSSAMDKAVSTTLASDPSTKALLGNNNPDDILKAFQSGDWSGVTDLTGKPFSDEQQKAAVSEAEKVLGPAYDAQKTYDTAATENSLRNTQEGLTDTLSANKKNFIADKTAADQSAADNGVLFSGARAQKLQNLAGSYSDADAKAARDAAEAASTTARTYQYNYGNDEAAKLSNFYNAPGPNSYNPNVASGGVKSGSLSTFYSPGQYNFQGTQAVAQKANVQTRAATQLANKANKLSLSGLGTKF